MSEIEIAALTSYSTAPLDHKIREVAEAGIEILDLYCFCPEDLRVLCSLPQAPKSFSAGMGMLDPSSAADKIARWCEEARSIHRGKQIDICGIASFVPDISAADEPRRIRAVRIMGKLLSFMWALRERGFSCDTFELVAGHTIQSLGPGDACDAAEFADKGGAAPACLKQVRLETCLGHLVGSLTTLHEQMLAISWPRGAKSRSDIPVLAVELEPSVSRLLCNRETVLEFLRRTGHCRCLCMNLDIGHARILDIRPKHVGAWGGRVAHCHVSDNARSHFADLELGTYTEKQYYVEWLRELLAWRQSGTQFLGRVSIELESCGDIRKVIRSYRKVKGWLREAGAT